MSSIKWKPHKVLLIRSELKAEVMCDLLVSLINHHCDFDFTVRPDNDCDSGAEEIRIVGRDRAQEVINEKSYEEQALKETAKVAQRVEALSETIHGSPEAQPRTASAVRSPLQEEKTDET